MSCLVCQRYRDLLLRYIYCVFQSLLPLTLLLTRTAPNIDVWVDVKQQDKQEEALKQSETLRPFDCRSR